MYMYMADLCFPHMVFDLIACVLHHRLPSPELVSILFNQIHFSWLRRRPFANNVHSNNECQKV